MNLNHHASVGSAPHVNVAALVAIVSEILASDRSEQQTGVWLQQRAHAAGLGEHEQTALEALRVQVYERGAAMGDQVVLGIWK